MMTEEQLKQQREQSRKIAMWNKIERALGYLFLVVALFLVIHGINLYVGAH